MLKLIEEYLKDHDKAWEETTKRSERARLQSVASALDGNPETLWQHFESRDIKPYSRVTAWTRVACFFDWAIERELIDGPNRYKIWRKKNARLFKHSYERKSPNISFKEARARIAKIEDEAIKRKALELLHGGLRYSESYFVNDNGVVIGKGRKRRDVFLPDIEGPEFNGSYHEFWRTLSTVGLKPHMLRKIRATDLARKGMDIRSICEVMGWSKLETAMSYVAPLKKEEMEKFFK